MRRSFTSPRSLSAVKVFASKLRKASPELSQSEALEQGAKFAGCANWKHATRELPNVMPLVRLSAPWANGIDRTAGVETISYPLPWSAAELIGTIKNSDRVSCLDDGAMIADCLLGDESINQILHLPFPNQTLARKVLIRNIRELLFREASGLAHRYNLYFDSETSGWSEKYAGDWDLPGADYFTTWTDPNVDSPLIFAEFKPADSARKDKRISQEVWCKKHGYEITPLNWSGTLQTGLQPLLITRIDAGFELDRIKMGVDGLPDDFAIETWPGTSEVLVYPEGYTAHDLMQYLGSRPN